MSSEQLQKTLEKMQSLGKSMEETINQLHAKPELASHKTDLETLIQETQKLHDEMDSCQKDAVKTIATLISDKSKAEGEIRDCESKVTNAHKEISRSEASLAVQERESNECEQQISDLDKALKQGEENQKHINKGATCALTSLASSSLAVISGVAAVAAGPFFLIPGAIFAASSLAFSGAAIAEGSEVKGKDIDVNDIRNRMQSQRDKINLYRGQINTAKQSIESNQRDIDQLTIKKQECEIKIQKYEEISSAMILCKNILVDWLQFLKDLKLSMTRLEYHLAGGSTLAAVKDTVAYQDYLKFINGPDANKSLKAATNMRQITSMNLTEIMNVLSDI